MKGQKEHHKNSNSGGIIGGIILIVIIFFAWKFFTPAPKWMGFYYPTAGDLQTYHKSPSEFDTIDECRDWIDEQVDVYNPTGEGYDYECGSSCKLSDSGIDIYHCNETKK